MELGTWIYLVQSSARVETCVRARRAALRGSSASHPLLSSIFTLLLLLLQFVVGGSFVLVGKPLPFVHKRSLLPPVNVTGRRAGALCVGPIIMIMAGRKIEGLAASRRPLH